MGRQQTKCHGSEERFEVVARFIYERFGREITYIADVAGGQGMLTKLLNKKYNYRSEVIDPRGYDLRFQRPQERGDFGRRKKMRCIV